MENNKKIRQYFSIIIAIVAYYLIHEGAHLICALIMNVFKQINFLGLGIQIDVYNELMSNTQMGIFCTVGALATQIVGYILFGIRKKICKSNSKSLKAVMYYVTIVMMLLDPLYLSALCNLFGGGDMNGIALLIPINYARVLFGLLFVINVILFKKYLLVDYSKAFVED